MNLTNTSLILGLLIISCGVPTKDYNAIIKVRDSIQVEVKTLQTQITKLKSENTNLTIDLQECEFGAKRLIGKVNQAYTNKDYGLTIQYIDQLQERHPESPKNKEFKQLSKTIKRLEAEEIAKQKKLLAERIRLENLNNIGMWTISYYVDAFGVRTKKPYITRESDTFGTFSNSATKDSSLKVRFLITNYSKMSIMLFEYAGNNPVKREGSSYSILVKDKEGRQHNFSGNLYGDRIELSGWFAKEMHKVFMKGGYIPFRIKDEYSSEYSFSLNVNWYENAYRKLKES